MTTQGTKPKGSLSDPLGESVAEVQGILDRHHITAAEIDAHVDAEQAGIAAGTVVPITKAGPGRRTTRTRTTSHR